MYHDVVTPDDPVQEKSVIEPEVGKSFIPVPQTKCRKRKRGFENTGRLSLFEINAALMEENRKFELEVKRLQCGEAEAWNSKNIESVKLKYCENKLNEKRRRHSGKRPRIPDPNCNVVQAVRMTNSGPHSPVQHTGPDPTSDPTIGSK